MEKTILTPHQSNFLEQVIKETSLIKRFYLTGGTALSEFYFQHRLSEDIDLFSEQEISPQAVEAFLRRISPSLGVKHITKNQFLGLFTYKLEYKDGTILKVDFNYYPFPRIEKGPYFQNKLEVSSMYDIAVNKVHTIGMKPRARDYVDLFFIFKTSDGNIEELIKRMRIDSQAKFDWILDIQSLITGITRVVDFSNKDVPHMLVPFNWKEIEEYFLKLAKNLKSEIFK